jgi:hypothetical protein
MTSATLRTAIATAAAVVCVVGGGVAIAGNGPDTTSSVGPRVLIASPAPSPVHFPGVPAARAGEPLPRGYVAVSHDVSITRGDTVAYPAFTLRCPEGKRLKTFATKGEVSPQIVGRSPFVRRREFGYRNKRRWGVVVSFNLRAVGGGETVAGTVYGLCR